MKTPDAPTLWGISDLHVAHRLNRELLELVRPRSDDDWLIVAGDVGERSADIEAALRLLSERFARVIWVPGNHELWTPVQDAVQLRGVERYDWLVAMCRRLGVLTPEDDYPLWAGPGGPVRIAPLLSLYDFTWLAPGTTTREQSLARAYETGVVCSDEFQLHADPYPDVAAWCQARVAATELRLEACPRDVPLVLVSHWPLVREPTRVLRYPEFAQWCGTKATADWHRRFRTELVVYGHLHIPSTTVHEGVRHEEVSLGYPREWQRHGLRPGLMKQLLPRPGAS